MRNTWGIRGTWTAVLAVLLLSSMPVAEAGPTARLLWADRTSVWTIRQNGADARAVASAADTAVSWGPGGTAVAYTRHTCVGTCAGLMRTHAELRTVRADGSGDRLLLSLPGVHAGAVRWSPDGRWVAFVANTVTCWGCPAPYELHVYDVTTGGHFTLGPATSVAWSPDSTRLAMTVPGAVLVTEVAAGAVPTRITSTHLSASSPVWSPDGRRLAVLATKIGKVLSVPHVWILDADGTNPRELPTRTFSPITWDPAGNRFAAIQPEYDRIEIASVTGRHRRTVRTPPGNVYGVAWSPDGRSMAYVHEAGGDFTDRSIRSVRPDGDSDRELARGEIHHVDLEWSRP